MLGNGTKVSSDHTKSNLWIDDFQNFGSITDCVVESGVLDESKFNPNPVYRDTITVNTDEFVVVQVAANNPGVWRWHCHVNIHHRSGMAMLLDVGGDTAVEAVRATPASANLCPIQPGSAAETDFTATENEPSASGTVNTDSTSEVVNSADAGETGDASTEDADESNSSMLSFTWAMMCGFILVSALY